MSLCAKFQLLTPLQSKVIEPGGKHPPLELLLSKKLGKNRVKVYFRHKAQYMSEYKNSYDEILIFVF